MGEIYNNICNATAKGEKLLAVLIDPDKFILENTERFIEKVNCSKANFILVGGSTVDDNATDALVKELKMHTSLPVIIFPGDITQITDRADALLFLSLISGRNPEYLIGKHVQSVSKIRATKLELISTGYILIENGKETAVQRITGTTPMPRTQVQNIIDTAKAGELLGMKLIYLEAGSGALHPITPEIIQGVKQELNIPLIVGGGIKSAKQLEEAYGSGADIVVIGTAFEEDERFFDELLK
ncbi:geranylgeranylglyceryl/heptaprenylglyceryl phosphate synthase [Flavobacteriaceae bacterium SZ-1-7]|uniref:geranylgeranylglyceryl/heptaprenylglyceryl phosphate synthase n=1 Tax=Tamlana sedimenti TaxID=3134126 RepID=UPI0031270E63